MVNYENLCRTAHIQLLMNTQPGLTGPTSNTHICLHCWWVNCQFNSLLHKNPQKWHTVISYAPWKCWDIDKMSSFFLGMTITIKFARRSLRHLWKGSDVGTQFCLRTVCTTHKAKTRFSSSDYFTLGNLKGCILSHITNFQRKWFKL